MDDEELINNGRTRLEGSVTEPGLAAYKGVKILLSREDQNALIVVGEINFRNSSPLDNLVISDRTSSALFEGFVRPPRRSRCRSRWIIRFIEFAVRSFAITAFGRPSTADATICSVDSVDDFADVLILEKKVDLMESAASGGWL